MKTIPKKYQLLYLLILLFVSLLTTCKSDIEENTKIEYKDSNQICVVLAHPDDETIISGTLAMLNSKGYQMTIVYVTSGDDGPDETGQGLHGKSLAKVREQEAKTALKAIGIKKPPVFLDYPDSHVPDHAESIQHKLYNLFNEIKPTVVITFGPDGITGDWDHRMTGFATDFAFDRTDSGKLLLHMALSEKKIPMFANGEELSEQAIRLKVNVSGFITEKKKAVEAHRTQFKSKVRLL